MTFREHQKHTEDRETQARQTDTCCKRQTYVHSGTHTESMDGLTGVPDYDNILRLQRHHEGNECFSTERRKSQHNYFPNKSLRIDLGLISYCVMCVGLLKWYRLVKWNHCNSFKDREPDLQSDMTKMSMSQNSSLSNGCQETCPTLLTNVCLMAGHFSNTTRSSS